MVQRLPLHERIADALAHWIARHLPKAVVEAAFMRIWSTAIPDPENEDTRDIGEIYIRWMEHWL